jgi:pyruvate-formate lyase-activating enzyme
MKSLRAFANIGRINREMRARSVVSRAHPIRAYVDPFMACNLRCPACPTGLRLGLRPPTRIDPGLFRRFIDDVGPYLFELLLYNWGEPLLHPETPELVAYAKAQDIWVTLSTNLSLQLSEPYVERLVRSGLDELVVSLDGTTEDTYRLYRREGSFDRVRANMRLVSEIKSRIGSQTPTIVWQFLVFRHNEHQIEEARALRGSWGADAIRVAPAQMPAVPHDAGFEPSSLPQYNLYHPDHPHQLMVREVSSVPCSWLYGAVALNPDGSLSPCCATASRDDDFAEYPSTGGLAEVWNTEKYRRARSGRKTDSPPLASEPLRDVASRLNGMASGPEMRLLPDEIICDRCPIPFLKPIVIDQIGAIATREAELFLSTGRLMHFLRLALMGFPHSSPPDAAPGAGEVARQLRATLLRGSTSLHYRGARLVSWLSRRPQ